ncbi:MAG TPA: ABC transporter ATP-binding protein [Syntrophales bacterium]|nr:ABC transporter ATP-binding protein [Syntrophales bacterium]
MTEKASILEARNLVVVRGGVAVLDVNELRLSPGEILSVIGPNGAGKTTLLQALAGLIRPQKGGILFHGASVAGEASLAYRRRIAMVFQEPLLFDTTVSANVASGLKIRGVPRDRIAGQVERQVTRFGIAHLSDRSARTLSGGEAQRTSLARAFAVGPEILFLDEPFASLDPPTREELIEDLDRVLRETETTALMATHDREEALRISDRIAVMNGGKIVQADSPQHLMNRPADEFVASFVGMETILRGSVVSGGGRGTALMAIEENGAAKGPETAASGNPAVIEIVGAFPAGEEAVCVIRPEQVTVSLPDGMEGKTSARNVFAGRIAKIARKGLYYKLGLDCGFPLAAYVTAGAVEQLGLAEGTNVVASFKATAVQVIRHGASRSASRGE